MAPTSTSRVSATFSPPARSDEPGPRAAHGTTLKSLIENLLKAAVSIGLVLYLLHDARSGDPQTFARLLAEPKQWQLLIAAWTCFLLALGAGLVRWRLLAAAVGLDCDARQTLRIGIVAYMLDFVALGAAGGDLFKALSLRALHPGRGVHALTTVVADRLVGLTTLLLFACGGAWLLDASTMSGIVPLLAHSVGVATAIALLAAVALLLSRGTAASLAPRARHAPVLGSHLANLFDAVALYGGNPGALFRAALLGAGVHALNAAGYTLLASGLSAQAPSFVEHLLIVPLASLSGILPLPADTLGVLDYAMSYLYQHVTDGRSPASLGLLAVMSYRVVGIAVTAAGILLYWTSPGSVRDLARKTVRSGAESGDLPD